MSSLIGWTHAQNDPCLDQHWLDIDEALAHWVDVHDDVIKWKHFPRYWPFVRGIHWSLVSSPNKGQWCGALMFSLICTWTNSWVNNRHAGDLRHHCSHYDITVMQIDAELRVFVIWESFSNGLTLWINPLIYLKPHNMFMPNYKIKHVLHIYPKSLNDIWVSWGWSHIKGWGCSGKIWETFTNTTK